MLRLADIYCGASGLYTVKKQLGGVEATLLGPKSNLTNELYYAQNPLACPRLPVTSL